MNVEITHGIDYHTNRPCEVGRIEENHRVTLAFRFTDDESDWFPSWLGRKGEQAVQVPPGWALSPEMLFALAKARPTGPKDAQSDA